MAASRSCDWERMQRRRACQQVAERLELHHRRIRVKCARVERRKSSRLAAAQQGYARRTPALEIDWSMNRHVQKSPWLSINMATQEDLAQVLEILSAASWDWCGSGSRAGRRQERARL